jgi:hypothetical protein
MYPLNEYIEIEKTWEIKNKVREFVSILVAFTFQFEW